MRRFVALVASILSWVMAGAIVCDRSTLGAPSETVFQTNRLNHTEVVMGVYVDRVTFKAIVPKDEAAHGWMIWDVEISDGAGKTEKVRTGWSVKLSSFGSQPGPLKISARGLEFISAGYADRLKANSIQTLTVTERARLLGVREGFLFGQGNFVVFNGVPTIDVDEPWPPDKSFHSEFQNEGWVASFPSKGASIVLLYEPTGDGALIKARLRERDERQGGGLFAPLRQHDFKTSASTMLRHFAFQNPVTRHRLEAEIIVQHPPVEFMIDP